MLVGLGQSPLILGNVRRSSKHAVIDGCSEVRMSAANSDTGFRSERSSASSPGAALRLSLYLASAAQWQVDSHDTSAFLFGVHKV